MGLEQIVNTSLVESMKKGDKIRTETLRSLKKSIIEFKTSGVGHDMTPDDELKILNSAAKQRKDAIEMYKQAGRVESAEKEESELKIIQEFLPKQLSVDEVTAIIKNIMTANNIADMKDMGKLMGAAMKELKGKADGSVVQKIVKELLA